MLDFHIFNLAHQNLRRTRSCANTHELPLFQAHGYIMGRVELFEQGNTLILENGQRLKIHAIFSQLRALLPKILLDDPLRVWGVYPRTDKEGKVISVQLCRAPMVAPPLGFIVSGQVVYSRPDEIVLSIRRNSQPPAGQAHFKAWQPFLITLTGSLPELQPQQHWRIQCELKDGNLVIREGIKIADAPERQPKPKPVKAKCAVETIPDSTGLVAESV